MDLRIHFATRSSEKIFFSVGGSTKISVFRRMVSAESVMTSSFMFAAHNEDSASETCVGLCNVGMVVFLLKPALQYFCFLEERRRASVQGGSGVKRRALLCCAPQLYIARIASMSYALLTVRSASNLLLNCVNVPWNNCVIVQWSITGSLTNSLPLAAPLRRD